MGQAAYGISAEGYNDLKALYNAKIVDTCIVMHGGGAPPPTQFPIDAKNAGTSRLANNGNDGVGGWDGSANYYPHMASLGYVGCGGESEQQAEIDSIMANMVFIDMGGEGTPGGYQDDIWRVTHPGPVSGHGAACRLETYDSNTNFWGWNVIGQAVKDAASHGVKEIGILIGNWMLYHTALKECRASGEPVEKVYADKIKGLMAVDEYIQLGHDIENNGIKFGGMWVWAGYGSNMNSLYQQFAGWYQAFMAVWPADMRTMDVRYGATPPPPPTSVTFVGDPFFAPDGSMYIRGSDKALWRELDGVFTSLGGICTSDACADNTHAFVIGSDSQLYYRPITTGGQWKSLGGVCTSAPALDGKGYVYTKGTTGALYKRTLTTEWVNAYSFVGDPFFAPDGSMYIRGPDKAIWREFNGVFTSLGGICTSDAFADDTNVFVRGSDNALWYRPIAAGGVWKSLSGILTSAPALDGKGYVYVIGSNGSMYKRTMTTGWVQVYPKIKEGEQ
jgi:hypothetical protein